MKLRRVDSVCQLIHEVFSLVDEDMALFPNGDVHYYFRGERINFDKPGSDVPMVSSPQPGLFRDGSLEYESDIFNEAIRTFPTQFKDDRTTFEKLARMQHYGYKTRLLDVSPKIMTALAMVLQPNAKNNRELDKTGFVHIYRVDGKRIKYSSGDTVTALANLARIQCDHILLDDLSYLAYECRNERAGFHWERKNHREGDILHVSESLDRDIGKVWCVKPAINNPRIDFQVGEFFIFGCGDRKSPIEASFTEDDYWQADAATFGIARIGVIALSPELKHDAIGHELYLDIGLERNYPDFHYHSQKINERYTNHE